MVRVRQPIVVAGAAAEDAVVGMQSLENRDRLPRTIEVECVAGELLPHELRAGKRVSQSLAERVRGRKIAATAGHHTVDLQLLEWREIHPGQALGDGRGRIALI